MAVSIRTAGCAGGGRSVLRVGSGEIGWICILAAFPFALCGFFTYNGMTFEKFLLAVIRSKLLYPRKLVFQVENLCAQAMKHSTVKEALKID